MLEEYIYRQLITYKHICISDITIENIITYINSVCKRLNRILVKVDDKDDILRYLDEKKYIFYTSSSVVFTDVDIDLSRFFIITDNPVLRQLSSVKIYIVECRKLFLLEQFTKKN